jgi:hypothetical protein
MAEPTATNPQTGEKIVFRNGQWVPLATAPANSDPIVRPAPTPAPPSGYQRTADGGLAPIPGGPADPNRPQPPKEQAAPSGYRFGAGGNLEFIPGGPADPATNQDKPGKALRQGDSDKLRTAINQFASFTGIGDSFTDDYGGNWAGGIENAAQRYSPVEMGTPGQAEWWAGLYEIDNLIRNDLFGASLTQGEKQAYARTTVTPGMRPDQIRANLARREDIMRGALSRYVNGLKAGGWSEQEIDALMGDVTPRIFPNSAPAGQEQRQDGIAPPAIGGQAAPPASGAPPLAPDQGGVPPTGDGRILGNTHNSGDDRQAMALSDNTNARRDNPLLAGVRDEYLRRLGEGQSAEQLVRWAKEAGVHPSAFPSIGAQAKFRRENPEVPLGEYDTSELDDEFVKIDSLSQGVTNFARSPVGAFIMGAGDAASGFTLDNLVGLTGGNAEQARLGMEQVAQEQFVPHLAGTVAGGTMMALGGEATLGARGIAAGLPRALAADAAYGTAAGAGATDYGADGAPATASDRLMGAAKGAAAAAGGSFVGNRTGNALAAMGRGAGGSVNSLRNEGINALTVGQTYGNSGRIGAAVKGVEDRLSGLPVVGDMVNARRAEGVRQFNSRAFDKALEPIGGTVGDLVGEEAVNRAQDAVSQAFTSALAGKGAVADAAFGRDLSSAVMGVRSIKRLGEELNDEVADIFRPYADDPVISGEALDDISRNLRDLKARYMQDPLGVRAAKQIDRVERAVFDLFDRQASGTTPEYQAARQAYRRVSILEDAVLKARNQDDRVFTPAQLGQADRANAKKFGGKRAAARGDTPFHDYQTAGQAVLPNKVPDSGTAGRVLVPLVALGAGGASDQSGVTNGAGLTIGAILAGLYSKTGQRLLTKPGRGMTAGTRRRALMESPRTQRAIAATGAAGSAAALTDQR